MTTPYGYVPVRLDREVSSSNKRRLALITPIAATALAAGVVTGSSAAAATDVPDRWETVVQCESGGDPNAVNPSSGAAGAWQFMPSTWAAHAPAGYPDHPTDASIEQQLVVAERVLEAQGPSAWVCPGAPGSSTPVSEPQSEPEPEPEAPSPEPETLEADAEKPTSVGSSPQVDPQYPADNYVIKSGDTLGQIADEHGTSVDALVDANPRTVEDPDVIYPGEGLYIP